MDASKLIEKAIERLVIYHPFFAYIALQIKFEASEKVLKMTTNGVRIRYNPEWVKVCPFLKVVATIAHEILHIISMHHLRMKDREHERFNDAADYAINPLLQESGLELDNGLLNLEYNGKSAEEIYEILEQQEQEEEQQDQEDQHNENGEGDSNEHNQSGEASEDTNESSPGEDPNTSNSSCDASDKGTSDGEVEPAPDDIPEVEQERMIEQMIEEASQQAEMAGTMTNGLRELVRAIKEPKQDWEELLQKFVAEAAANDYDWEVPDLQYLQNGIYIPSLHSLSIGNIIFAIDKSCSINTEVLKVFLSEIREAAQLFSDPVTVILCDTKVQLPVLEVDAEDIEDIEVIGRGGTRFSPVFDYIEENDLTPKALIYLTDGECWETLTEPEYPVLWAKYGRYDYKPQFGELINID